MKKYILSIAILFICSKVSFGQKKRSSKNFKALRYILKCNPEIDTDKDGILTETEYRTFQGHGIPNRKKLDFKGYYSYVNNLPYVDTGNEKQTLDILTPVIQKNKKLPAIIFIHGGGWKKGSKEWVLRVMDPILASGDYIGVSVNYRLSGDVKWPAQLYDCKAAIRWVKANAKTYGIDKDKIAIWGTSAGGHIASMLAVTAGNNNYEGNLGNHLSESSTATCVIDGYGPKDLLINKSVSAIPKLVGNNFKDTSYNAFNLLVDIKKLKERAKKASPLYHINPKMTPLFLYHGTEDSIVDIAHSQSFYAKAKALGVSKIFLTKVNGLKHEAIISKALKSRLFKFLEAYLYNKKGMITSGSI